MATVWPPSWAKVSSESGRPVTGAQVEPAGSDANRQAFVSEVAYRSAPAQDMPVTGFGAFGVGVVCQVEAPSVETAVTGASLWTRS